MAYRIAVFVTSVWIACSTFADTVAKNTWFRVTNSPTVIIFLHGILSDSRACWTSDTTPPVYWPDLVAKDNKFDNAAIFLAGYYTNVDSGDYGISNAAAEVFAALKRPDTRGVAVLDKPNLIFVCHSLGGVIARYLIDANQPVFEKKNVGIVLIASPSYGSRDADRLEWLSSYFGNALGAQLRWGSSSLHDLDTRFKELVYQRRIPNLVGVEAYESKFIVPTLKLWHREQLVTEESAGRYFGAPVALPGMDHFAASKPTSYTHATYLLLLDFYQQQYKPMLRRIEAERAAVGCVPVIQRRWVRIDDNGNALSQSFTLVSQPALAGEALLVAGQFTLQILDARIYRVEFSCSGAGCDQDYNPDSGYAPKTAIAGDGKSFTWSRKWAGPSVSETYTAYYELSKDVCVANCK